MGDIFENLSGAKASRAEGKSAQNLAEFNAAVSEQEAKAIRAKGTFEGRRAATDATARRSALKAKIATAGGASSPVAEDIIAAQAAEDELEQLLIGFEAETGARRAESQAAIDRLGGKAAKQRGKNRARAANIGLATQIATTPVGAKGKTLLTGF
jgi:hypothetical protein